LALGGGGVVGSAFHAGALTALEQDLGWDPRAAEVIVGTSAGSVVGALLRVGVPASDLAAHAVGALRAASHPLVTEGRLPDQELPAPPLPGLIRWPRRGDGALWSRWLARPWSFDPVGAMTAVLPDGTVSIDAHVTFLDEAASGAWPSRPLWITAVRRRDLRRVVFGRDQLLTRLSAAVAASCAIPGYFAPVRIGSDAYVDGGVHSPTNADVLRREQLDLVIVSSPMSAERVTGFGPAATVRRFADQKLREELRRLRAARTPAVVLAPGPEVVRHTGHDLMSADHLVDVVRESFLGAGRQLLLPGNRAKLAGLSSRAALRAAS